MKRALLLLLALCMTLSFQSAHAEIRIACVGDSITYGATITGREDNAYPAQLQAMLGHGYSVKNFGVNGATLLTNGNKPYIKLGAYRDALAFMPDLVVIMLGTNDTKQVNWEHAEAFVENYKQLISSFRDLESEPEVIIALPVPAWTAGDHIDGGRVREGVIPKVRQVAYETGVRLVDLHTPLLKFGSRFQDKLHPDGLGADEIAKRIYEQIVLETDPNFDITNALPEDRSAFDFHGYRGSLFKHDGAACRVVRPKTAAKGRPWIWRARFWGHEPQLDLAMLERGFHVVYCDVADLFGSAKAVERWDGFYTLMREAGLGEDLVLEGMSRGGLIIYNWAKANPDKVKAIYADAPVCDIRSWPGGKGVSKGRAASWEQCLSVYGLTEETSQSFAGNPIDGLEPLAKADVPVLHVVGDADDVVPIAENSAVIEERYRALGGTIELIHKPGVGHHPHGLPDPEPIVNFLLKSTNRKINFAALPVGRPSAEYRSGAGWGKDTWMQQHRKINQLGKDHPEIGLVFLGDSISQGWTGAHDRLAKQDGKRVIDRYFGQYNAASFGLAGDRTEHILWRINYGNLEHIQPRLIVLMIGVNNINAAGHTGDEVGEGTQRILDALAEHAPQTKVLMLGCFPTGSTADAPSRKQVDALHDAIQSMADGKRVIYRDLRLLFLNDDGTPNANMRPDHIHLSPAGYEAWAKAIHPMVDEMMDK